MDVTLDKQSPIRTGAIIYSQDRNSAYFKIKLNAEMDEVVVLFKAINFDVQVEATKEGDEWFVHFDHTLISVNDEVRAFVYGKFGDKNYDIGVARFTVNVSEIDKTVPRIKVVYFQTLEDVAGDMADWIADYQENVGDVAQELRDTFEGNEGERQDTFDANEEERQSEFDQSESSRDASEKVRVDSENIRETNETNRQVSESNRDSEESDRIENERQREAAEVERQETFEANEANRQIEFEENETERQANELVREEAEGNRQSTFEEKEVGRQSEFEENELARESAESVRVANEEERITKDSERDSKIEAVEGVVDDVSSKVDSKANKSMLLSPKYDLVYDSCVRDVDAPLDAYSVPMESGHYFENVEDRDSDATLTYEPDGVLLARPASRRDFSPILIENFDVDFPYFEVRTKNLSITNDKRTWFVKYKDKDNWVGFWTGGNYQDVIVTTSVEGVQTNIATESTGGSAGESQAQSGTISSLKAEIIGVHNNFAETSRALRVFKNKQWVFTVPIPTNAVDFPNRVGFSVESATEILNFKAGRS